MNSHRLINLLLVIGGFIFIYFLHVPFVKLSVVVMNVLTLPVYNQVVAAIAFLSLLLFIVFRFTQFRKNTENRTRKMFYLIVIASLMVIHFKTMFEMNIEIIHSLEFTVLAFLLYPLTGRYGAALFFTIPFMFIDEWHQYIILYPGYVEFFEFNDV